VGGAQPAHRVLAEQGEEQARACPALREHARWSRFRWRSVNH
jgi:hypothetical protein